jgi:hypothetical protein
LAIVDGRIVSAGDQVRRARVVDITAGVVLLRDAQGRLRRLSLGASSRHRDTLWCTRKKELQAAVGGSKRLWRMTISRFFDVD